MARYGWRFLPAPGEFLDVVLCRDALHNIERRTSMYRARAKISHIGECMVMHVSVVHGVGNCSLRPPNVISVSARDLSHAPSLYYPHFVSNTNSIKCKKGINAWHLVGMLQEADKGSVMLVTRIACLSVYFLDGGSTEKAKSDMQCRQVAY